MGRRTRYLMLAGMLLQVATLMRALAFQATSPAASQAQPQSSGAASPPKPTAPATPSAVPAPPSQDEINRIVQERIREALGQNRGRRPDGNPQMSPETEKAIAEAVQKFLADPEVKSAITEKIHQFTPPGRREMLAAIFVPISFFGVVALIAWLFHIRSRSRLRAQMDMQTQLLGKFNSGTELAAFLSSPAGQQFASGLTTAPVNTQRVLVKHASVGAVLTALGLGMILFGRGATFPSVVILSAGIGFLIAALLTQRLSRKMEAVGPNTSPPIAPPPLQ